MRRASTTSRHLTYGAACLSLGCSELGVQSDTGPVRLHTVWHTRTPGSGVSGWLGRPAVDGGRVFVQAANEALGLDAATGAVLWSRPVRRAPSPPPTTLLARDGRVYVSETDSVLALDAATGRTVWNFHPDSQAVVAPALDATNLYTGQRGRPVVYALGLADGVPRWRVDLSAGRDYSYQTDVKGVAVSGDTVYVAITRGLTANYYKTSGVLAALDSRDGHELWRYETPGEFHGFADAPLVGGGLVIVNDFMGNAVVGYNVAAQRVAWTGTLDRNGPTASELHSGVVYVAGADAHAWAFDAITGAVRWKAGGLGSALGGAYCASGFFVNDERLRRFNAASGSLTGQTDAGSGLVFSSNIVADGQNVYFTGADGAYAVACR